MKIYPKILLLNINSFNDHTGGGITLKNLFRNWPIDKLAVAHLDSPEPMADICNNYYKIGTNEFHYIFPLNLINRNLSNELEGSYSPKLFNIEQKGYNADYIPETFSKLPLLKSWFFNYMQRIGLMEIIHPISVSEQLAKWIKEYNPDIIYCQGGNLTITSLAFKVYKLTKAKVIIHIMDDWPSTKYKDKLFGYFIRLALQTKFRKLLRVSSLRLGISQAMAEEFEFRYKLSFKYFHNPVIPLDFAHEKDLETKKDHFLIVYSGRIGIASYNSILDLAICTEQLNKDGINIKFYIYTDLENKDIDLSKFSYAGSFLFPPLKDNDLFEKMLEADLLFYPVDFDRKSIEYIRLSFPTKLPSYLISGVPVLCYGPQDVYSIKFIREKKVGFVCTDRNIDALKNSVKTALTNQILRKEFSANGRLYAKNNFDDVKIRKLFHEEIINCLETTPGKG